VDLNQLTEKHGKQATLDLLNIIFISDWKQPEGGWRMYCLRHGMVTRNTKTVRCWYGNKVDVHWYAKGEVYKRWDEPNVTYKTTLKNGSNKTVLDVHFTQTQLEEWKQREANPNQA
jgi:hypothetical protein